MPGLQTSLREDVIDDVLGALGELVREEHVEADNEIAPLGWVFGEWQAIALQPFGGGRLEHLPCAVDPHLLPLQRGHLHHRSAQGLAQRDLVGVL